MPAPDDWMERACWVLDLGGRGYAPLTWRDEMGLAGMAFSDRELAEAHRRRLGGLKLAARLRCIELGAGDMRAREEWLRAVLNAGAARVAFDLDPQRPQMRDFELTASLLAEVLSQRRPLACL